MRTKKDKKAALGAAILLLPLIQLLTPLPAEATTPVLTGHPYIDGVISTVVYSLVGMAMAFLAFRMVDIVTPGELGKEIGEKQNVALAILAGFTILGICVIIAAALVG